MPKFLDTPSWYNDAGSLIRGQWCSVYTTYAFAAGVAATITTILPPMEEIVYGSAAKAQYLKAFLKNNDFMGTTAAPSTDKGAWIATGKILIDTSTWGNISSLYLLNTDLDTIYVITDHGTKAINPNGTWTYKRIVW